jgi:putative nucleotidyltransferase with HDIG domain
MKKEIVTHLNNWFLDYTQKFKTNDQEFNYHIILKEKHTLRVVQEILYIGRELHLKDEDLQIAELAALFHDIGRFEQLKQFKTYVDRLSVNHAELGVQILNDLRVLKELDDMSRSIVTESVRLHNKAFLPSTTEPRTLFFTKLVRDADKLDIFKIAIDYYSQPHSNSDGVVMLHLPDTPEVSDQICESLIAGKLASYDFLKTLNDFKLLQIGWAYDINFLPTYKRLKEKRYLELIYNTMPEIKKIDDIFNSVQSFIKLQEKQLCETVLSE